MGKAEHPTSESQWPLSRWINGWEEADHFRVNYRGQDRWGLVRGRTVYSGAMKVRFGFVGCCTSLLYFGRRSSTCRDAMVCRIWEYVGDL